MKFIVYDFEVFKYDWLVVLKELEKEPVVIVNDPEALRKFYEENKTNLFVGYNNKYYDDHILKGILSGLDPKLINDWIIVDKKSGWIFPGMKRYYIASMDLMQDVLALSLKEAEGNMGMSIEESSVDFNIDRKLTDEELKEVIMYCKHDVEATEQLMKARESYLKSKLILINMYNLPITDAGKTSAQLTATILGAHKKSYYDEMFYDYPEKLKLKDQEIIDNYVSPLDYNRTLDKDVCGVPHRLAYGGLHGAIKGIFEGDLMHIDVTSYYPSMMINLGFMSRSLRVPGKFKEIYDTRVKLKANKDPRQKAFKLILNSTYGAMKNQYNPLHDPKQCNQICITGQLFLLDLLEKLEPYIDLIQSNTDGLIVRAKDKDKVYECVKEWEDRTGFKMECDDISKIWQKDVNNYIVLMKNGDIEVKGGYVRNFNGGNFQQNSNTIIDKAVVEYFVNNIPVEETINNCNDIIKFQMITKKGPTYSHVTHEVNGEEIKVNNVNRVFATKDTSYGTLYKHKTNGRKDKSPGVLDNCIVCNKEISNYTIDIIDKDWYIKQAKDRINDFLKEDKK